MCPVKSVTHVPGCTSGMCPVKGVTYVPGCTGHMGSFWVGPTWILGETAPAHWQEHPRSIVPRCTELSLQHSPQTRRRPMSCSSQKKLLPAP